ncbi:DUF3859 domain-containing protein [Paracrocinitomix mangrovi]|uniref:DUF3859 domain-containing protein n=1 Tax=Paracrocinitomix mangrovi TaxID=2862509 RepID=UPI001C8E53FD|nr:DUF3859 domain-containing protein [Paracrocinitomix mangrovi]UKN03238.1 DUF3859 domain-containing protein [Paracrocinitomix mangrovi]
MKRLIFLMFPLFLFSCSTTMSVSDKPVRLRVKTMNAGVCHLLETNRKKSSKSPSGYKFNADFIRLNESTDTIKAAIGTRFGVEYVAFSSVYTEVPFKAIWTFPKPIVNEKGKEFSSVKTKIWLETHTRYFSTYSIEKEYEIVKGDWKFELFYGKKLVLTKVFHLI